MQPARARTLRCSSYKDMVAVVFGTAFAQPDPAAASTVDQAAVWTDRSGMSRRFRCLPAQPTLGVAASGTLLVHRFDQVRRNGG